MHALTQKCFREKHISLMLLRDFSLDDTSVGCVQRLANYLLDKMMH